MWDFKIGRSFGLMFQTLPFIALRAAVYFGCSLLLILGFIGGPAMGAWIAPDSLWKAGAWIGFGIGASAASTAVYFIREYFLYLVKAGHIAVLVELMEGRKLPKGKSQLGYAKDIVASRFTTASTFFLLDQVITGILGLANKMLIGLGSFIPGMDGAMAFIGQVLKTSLTFADEVILALSFKTGSTDIWRTSRDGVVLYAQNYKTILKNAFFLALLNYALIFFFFILAWAPAAKIASLMPGTGSALLAFVVTLLLVYSIKKAFIEPLLMTALMQVYFGAIAGQTPNPEWTKKLENLSDKFGKMKDKFVGPEPEPGQAMIGAPEASLAAALPQEQWPAPQVPQQQSPEQLAYQAQQQQAYQAQQQQAYQAQQQQAYQAQQQQAYQAQQQQAYQAQQQQAYQAQQQQAYQAQQQQAYQAQAYQAQQQQAYQAQRQVAQPIGSATLPMGTIRRTQNSS